VHRNKRDFALGELSSLTEITADQSVFSPEYLTTLAHFSVAATRPAVPAIEQFAYDRKPPQ
jgi:hypothetical protein